MRLAASGAALLLASAATLTTADSDLWGHLRFGLDILASHRLPFEDPYSFTQDRPWINHEWLSELQMAAAYSAGGVAGLALLKGALVASALALVWTSLGDVRTDIRIAIFGAIALGTVPVTRTLRPQLWTLVSLAILTRVLLRGSRRARRWLPLLFVFWANSHGGWIVGFGVLGLWLALEALDERKLRIESALLVLVSALASLATPYGWTLWAFLAETVSLSGRAITEWQPLWRSPPADAVPWAVAVAAVVALAWTPFPRRLPVVGSLAMLGYASLNVIRIVPLFVLCAGVLLSPAFARRWPRKALRQATTSQGELPVGVVLMVLAVAGSVWLLNSSLRCIRIDGPRVPEAAARDLLRTARPGRLVTFFDWGEYALWHLGPQLRVSMDGRRETIYSDARLDEHAAILEGWPTGFNVLAGWRPEYVWLPATSAATRTWLASHGYRLEHDTEGSFVAVRSDLPALRLPADGGGQGTACFPG
jgi:hypothetical protein